MTEQSEELNTMIVTDTDGMPIGVQTGDASVDDEINTWITNCKRIAEDKHESSEIREKIRACKEIVKKSKENHEKWMKEREAFWNNVFKKMDEEDAELEKKIICTIS